MTLSVGLTLSVAMTTSSHFFALLTLGVIMALSAPFGSHIWPLFVILLCFNGMAPPKTHPEKRIKTTARQPFRGPSFDSHTFRDKEHQEFYPKLEERSLWMEKMVKLKPTEYPEFQAEIQRRKWEKLASYMASANISVEREFYCNAWVLSKEFPEYTSYVRAWPGGPAQQQGEGDAADDDEESEEESEEEDDDEEEEESDEAEEDEEKD
ncbi:pre-mRNA-splicing factor CWC22-like [Cajanus cajan]|uniref:pre-mRNA-splicing factor CWC22-like n=1 Tax=Cajanus cajan TaxID=3821 RepID=UPI00098DA111|nr:pre-mRNA-splicing factor CWC22-like [Cajanus cajan]